MTDTKIGRPKEHDEPATTIRLRATGKEVKDICKALGTRERTEVLLRAANKVNDWQVDTGGE